MHLLIFQVPLLCISGTIVIMNVPVDALTPTLSLSKCTKTQADKMLAIRTVLPSLPGYKWVCMVFIDQMTSFNMADDFCELSG